MAVKLYEPATVIYIHVSGSACVIVFHLFSYLWTHSVFLPHKCNSGFWSCTDGESGGTNLIHKLKENAAHHFAQQKGW